MSSMLPQLQKLAVQALNKGAYKELIQLCQQILSIDQNNSEAWFFLSIATAANMQIGKAVALVDKALSISPENVEYLAQKSKFHSLLNQYESAIQAADKATKLGTENALALDTIGVVYTKLGEYEKALAPLKKAVEKQPKNSQFHFNLASVEQFLGNADAARKHYEAAIKAKPDFARAHWSLSELEKVSSEAVRIEQLSKQLGKQNLRADDELYLCHALSRELEKAGEYSKAFDALERGKSRRSAQISYSTESDKRLFEAMKQAFPLGNIPEQAESNLGEGVVFVLGMPRSGTTLLERILDSHSQVTSLGELQDFGLAVRSTVESEDRVALNAEIIGKAAEVDSRLIGEAYSRTIAPKRPGSVYIIDKMPLNLLYVGFIIKALPKAKLICLRRNPMDTVLSNFRQLFAINFSYYNYHYDLIDTALYYSYFDDIMSHWKSLFGNKIFEIEYEQITREPEQSVRSALEYLELPWEAECLNFHRNKAAVATASSMQVREKLYSSAVDRWRKYEPQLQRVQDFFDQKGIKY